MGFELGHLHKHSVTILYQFITGFANRSPEEGIEHVRSFSHLGFKSFYLVVIYPDDNIVRINEAFLVCKTRG